MCITTELNYLLAELKDQWLEDNATQQKDVVAYGCTWVEKNIGYSDQDLKTASKHAAENLKLALEEVIKNNQ